MPSGNEPYASMVAEYWSSRGDAKVWISPDGEIASNLTNGLPPGYVGELRKARWYTKGDKRPDRRRPALKVVR